MPGEVNEQHQNGGGLYDLRRDPGERYNVSESHPEIVEKLEQIANVARELKYWYTTNQDFHNII